MTIFTLQRNDAALQGFDSDLGLPVVFQHGLGGSNAQVAENFPDHAACRRLTLECRAQGGSAAGSRRPFSIEMFAADVLAACDARGMVRFVAGGISTGAAIALHLAARYPHRVTGLILARPAWLFEPAPANMRPFVEVADTLRLYGPAEGKARFAASPMARMLATEAPDNLASLLGFFERPDPAVTADLLSDIAQDGPGISRPEAARLTKPTLVLGHGIDHIHPLSFAQALAAGIPGARLVEIPPKATHKPAHVAAFRDAVNDFLQHVASRETEPNL